MAPESGLVDHLFRHQYAKYVAILTRIFGIAHIETIEDALQDTFAKATVAWRSGVPNDPEAWLTAAAKNRATDLFRKLAATRRRESATASAEAPPAFDEFFLDDQVADAQLRMVFTACHPALDPRDQLAFALRTVSGFSGSEIASALLAQPATIKKRLTRARAAIRTAEIRFEIPQGKDLEQRFPRVLEVVYLIFNEGFHSGKRELLVRKDLCGEAMRLGRLLLNHPRSLSAKPAAHALFALMCFHAARLETKVNEVDEIIDLRRQDRSRWHQPLIVLGNLHMDIAVDTEHYSSYHYEAAIAAEHLKATAFAKTDWQRIALWYERLEAITPSPLNLLNLAVVHLQANDQHTAEAFLLRIDPKSLGARRYLYHGCWAEWHRCYGDLPVAKQQLEQALQLVSNAHERAYLTKKLSQLATAKKSVTARTKCPRG